MILFVFQLRGFYRERQLERLKLLRRIGDLPPVFPNGWYCVCESERLAKNQIMEITVLGKLFNYIQDTILTFLFPVVTFSFTLSDIELYQFEV